MEGDATGFPEIGIREVDSGGACVAGGGGAGR